ncbi:hypothetical protein [Nocardioides panzhihuensis]|uniref:Uncharacterized protein n=1 Tax=Nocardioides panzhihuensis TaxID=860243 RepID=A0A7Z0IRE3_9ACTN|nr:hypothetical protein [Nocardioides panzhihuensis]NYI76627.1 hypothetical protein [Nocardioides panzhihuensis]
MASVPSIRRPKSAARVDAYPYALLTLRGFNSLQVTAAYRDAKRQEPRASNTEVDAALKDYISQVKPKPRAAGMSLEMLVDRFVVRRHRIPSLVDARDIAWMAEDGRTTAPVVQRAIEGGR